MKRLITIFSTVLFVLFVTNSIVHAQEETTPITLTEIEKIIDAKFAEQRPLTEDELTKIVLEMKNEKIANLEGNLSAIIDTSALFVGLIALALATVTGLIGWYIKKGIDEKLNKIEGIERDISKINANIQSKSNEIEEQYKEVKRFKDDLDKFHQKLDSFSSKLKEHKNNFDELCDLNEIMQNVTDSIILIFRYLNNTKDAEQIISETSQIIKMPQKGLKYVLYKLGLKLGMEFNNIEDVVAHLKYLSENLKKEESNLWDIMNNFEGVMNIKLLTDAETMTFYEEIETNYEDWNSHLNEIKTIKDIWIANLKMNSNSQNDAS
ncbi:hypothetical protein [Paenibacillus agri]|uniref:Uncharacterized protein n=1 Tax=Paenibacillus agri TaxID=2744309 RepID=A0A850EEI7_9BACL|nr:hypothetical protein [Paenibacillus agri]NUU59158.1 hypothetical protein [Paenibacillus agri]